ncbi:SMRP1 protein, partial [Todus mexicanus]|nr:SMRP1 protein [Todus mexicanus]
MFLFARKHKTPVSTYTDSYRPPCSVKRTVKDLDLQQVWKENNFVTQGLTMPPVQNPSQGQSEQLLKTAIEACCRNTTDPASFRPWKYWLGRSEEKYNPVLVNEDKYVTWRTGPYNSAAWNKHSSCLPLPPKDTRMETYLHSVPTSCSPKLVCFTPFEREVMVDMLHSVPLYSVTGRGGPSQGYYSPCSGRHYCLRGMDYYVDGSSAIRRHLHGLGERAVRSTPCCSCSPRPTLCVSTRCHRPSNTYSSPRWDTSHFKKIGGPRKGSYIIHPEFASEAYSAPGC